MRTKALLSVAAALAVTAVTAQAQNVYSVNVVGYVNQALPSGELQMVQNPLDDKTNTLSSVLAGLDNGSEAWVWNGSGYTPASKAKGIWSPDISVPTGVGMFVRSASDKTNTYVGEVLAGPGGSVVNHLDANMITLTGSLLPYGALLSNTNLGLDQLPNGSELWQWNGAGYTPASKAKGIWSPDLSIAVGEGFFLRSPSDVDWVQTLPAE